MAFVRHCRFQYRAIAAIVERVEALADGQALDDLSQGELKLFQGALLFWGGHMTEARKRLLAADELIPSTYGTGAGLVQTYIALTGQALGQSSRVLHALDARIAAAQGLPAKYRANLANARSLVHLLSGDLEQVTQGAHLVFGIANQRDLAINYAWGHCVAASAHFRALQLHAAVPHFLSVLDYRYAVQLRAAVDAMAGLALTYQSLRQGPAADSVADDMLAYAQEGDDLDLLSVAQSARARLALHRGDLDAAIRWALSHEAAIDAPSLLVWIENPAITRARVLVAIGGDESYREAATLLAAIAERIRKLHNVCQQIDVLVLSSLALGGVGQPENALGALRQAVRLGQRGGWMFPFAEAGPSVTPLLHRLAVDHRPDARSRAYLARVIATVDRGDASPDGPAVEGQQVVRADAARLVESLTVRELDILECLTKRLRTKEIARELSISEETVKFHLKNLYRKLGVSGRQEVARCAQSLQYLLGAACNVKCIRPGSEVRARARARAGRRRGEGAKGRIATPRSMRLSASAAGFARPRASRARFGSCSGMATGARRATPFGCLPGFCGRRDGSCPSFGKGSCGVAVCGWHGVHDRSARRAAARGRGRYIDDSEPLGRSPSPVAARGLRESSGALTAAAGRRHPGLWR
jgi:LuxR family maltose regulon positive regulatory protein